MTIKKPKKALYLRDLGGFRRETRQESATLEAFVCFRKDCELSFWPELVKVSMKSDGWREDRCSYACIGHACV